MKKNKIFIACDTTNLKKVNNIIRLTNSKKLKIGYKFGLEFLNSKNGRKFISKLKNKIIFGDYKFSDIPNTCSSAVKAIKDLNFNYITIHINVFVTFFNKRNHLIGLYYEVKTTSNRDNRDGHASRSDL